MIFLQRPEPPVYVDAVQWFKAGDHPAVEEFMDGDKRRGKLTTRDGIAFIDPGYWIATYDNGYIVPYSPSVFEEDFVSSVEFPPEPIIVIPHAPILKPEADSSDEYDESIEGRFRF